MPLLETFANASIRGFETFGPAGASTSYELIATVNGTGSVQTITFSSIPSTYKHLQIRATHAITGSAGSTATYLRVNGATTGYYSQWIQSTSSTPSAAFDSNGAQIPIGSTAGYIANAYSGTVIDVLDYTSTSKNKTIKAFSTYYSSIKSVGLWAGALNSTSAITSLTIFTSDNFTSISRFSLYGIKEA